MRRFYLILGFLTGWQSVTAQTLTPAQIFAKTIAVYKSAATYQDTGELVTHHKTPNRHFFEPEDYTTRKPFETAFNRKTGQFRFRYQDIRSNKSEPAYVIWSDGKQVKTWSQISKGVNQSETVRSALGTAAGISFSSSVRVPGLLLGFNAPNWNLMGLKNVVLLPPVTVNGKTCFHLRGTLERRPVGAFAKSPVPIKGPTESHPSIEVWIDSTTFLLIRASETFNRSAESFEHTITFQPALNQSINPKTLVFDYQRFP